MTRFSLLAAVCVVALAVSACGGGNGGGSTQFTKGATYTEALTSDPGNLHPLRAVQNTTNWVVPFAYDSLISIDEKGHISGQLAERWQVTPKKATFTLRPGITCADGTKLTARMVADTFEWIKDPKHKSTVIGDKLPDTDFQVSADDAARTVTVTLKRPYGFLLEGAGTVWIVCPKGLADPKSLAHATDGTGPYQLADYVADDHLTFTARNGYAWGPGGARTDAPGTPQKVVFRIIQNLTTQTNLLLSGELSSAMINGPDASRLKGQGYTEAETINGPYDAFYNERPGHPGADPKVREALTKALDLEQLRKVITQGTGARPPSLAILTPRPCHNDATDGTLPEHDLDGAKALLDEAGWKAGADGVRTKDGKRLSMTLGYQSGETPLSAGMELVGTWWKQLGVDVHLKGRDASAFTQVLFAGNDWDAAVLTVGLPYPNEFVSFATGPASPEGQNFAAITNDDYAKLSQQALATPGKPGCELWTRAEQALFRDVDAVPVAAEVLTVYSKSAKLAMGLTGTEPTSIRMLAR
jgi:peptide/nickel transport system substrate-binding protein